MTATLGGEVLGEIQSESWDIKSSLDPMRFPYSKAEETWLVEMDGVARTITVSGIYTTTSMTALNTWLDKIESFQNNNTGQSGLTFVSSFSSNRTASVGVDSFTFKVATSVIGQATYSLRLEEGLMF